MAEENAVIDTGSPNERQGGGGFPVAPPPIYTCTLTPELVAKAREELQEKPEWRLRDVQALRDMVLKDQPNLRTRLDDAFLLRFLRARKFDYDRALQLLLNYHMSRRAWPEVFHDLRPSTIKHVLDRGFLTVLPHPDPHGRYILCIRPGKWKPNDYPFVDNIRAIYLTLEKLIQAEETQVNGVVILADYSGVGLSHASSIGPLLAKKIVGILQDGFPIRIKAVNIINEPRIFKGIFAIIKPFLKEKMAERLPIHLNQTNRNTEYQGTSGYSTKQGFPGSENCPIGREFILHGSDLSSLHRNIPSSVLPEEYGGASGRFDASLWSQALLDAEVEFVVEFCQPDPLEGVVLPDSMLLEGEQGTTQCEDTYRGLRSQLYYCY